jgi:L-asparaginase
MFAMAVSPVLLIHGGATDRREYPDLGQTARALDRIVLGAAEILTQGGAALDATAHAIAALEADPIFNAGYGAKLQSDGIARLSASAMDGHRRRFGAVLNVQDLCHPSRLALALLDANDRVLDGTGAHGLAHDLRLPRRSPLTEARFLEWREQHPVDPYGTVGAVALDARGHTAAMTSTGGKGHERPGRVSDSATPSGNYADHVVAVSCTGIGEHIMEMAAAPRLAAWLECGLSLEDAAEKMLAELRAEERQLGFIAVDKSGNTSARYTTECMTYRIWKGGIREGWPPSEPMP